MIEKRRVDVAVQIAKPQLAVTAEQKMLIVWRERDGAADTLSTFRAKHLALSIDPRLLRPARSPRQIDEQPIGRHACSSLRWRGADRRTRDDGKDVAGRLQRTAIEGLCHQRPFAPKHEIPVSVGTGRS